MCPGPAPKPTAVRRKQGNPGKRALNDREPTPAAPSYVPRAPRSLSDEAKKEWRRVTRHLHQAGLYTHVDRAALKMYCAAFGRWVEAERKVEETGGPVLVSAETGNLYQHPWLHVANKTLTQVQKLAAEFGMTPASRSRAHVVPKRQADDLDRLMDFKIRALVVK